MVENSILTYFESLLAQKQKQSSFLLFNKLLIFISSLKNNDSFDRNFNETLKEGMYSFFSNESFEAICLELLQRYKDGLDGLNICLRSFKQLFNAHRVISNYFQEIIDPSFSFDIYSLSRKAFKTVL